MTSKNQDGQPARVEVLLATPEDEPVLVNLLELYIHDFSEFLSLDLGADGRFGYRNLPLYWRESNRHQFLVRIDGQLAGFVFVKGGSEISGDAGVWDMAEFFVVRRYRRRGIGTLVAHDIWRRFRGPWEIRVMEANEASRQFWERAVSAFAGKIMPSAPVKKNGKVWRVFSFESPSR
jgi:predicted acetyltransferase